MTEANDYRRKAEDDGARCHKGNESDQWTAEDRDGMAIVSDATSIAEAARLYCEDKGLTASHEILNRLVAAYRPYHVLAEFWNGRMTSFRYPASNIEQIVSWRRTA
jgi:hypothetical protein